MVFLELAAMLVAYLAGAWMALLVPDLLETGEPYIVSAAFYAGTGGTLYAPIQDLPFLHNNYNPFVQLLAAPILAWTGPSFVPMRALTIVAAVIVLLIVFRVVWRETGLKALALGAASLPLCCGFVYPWLVLGRVDGVGTCFSVAAVALALTRREGTARSRAPWIVLAWLAFASKQTMLGGAATILLDAVVRRRYREAVGFGAIYAVGVLLIVFIAQTQTNGQYWLHAIEYNAEHDRGGLWPANFSALEVFWAIGPALLIVLLRLPGLLIRTRGLGSWATYVVISFVWALFLLRKSGSHIHYFLEFVVALSILGGILAGRNWLAIGQSGSERSSRMVILTLLLLAVAIPVMARHHHLPQLRHLAWLWTREDPVPAEVRRRIAAAQRPCLLSAKLGTLAVEAGRPAIFDTADFVRLMRLGRWHPEDRLLPLLRGAYFPVVGVAEFPPDHPAAPLFDLRRVPGFVAALESAYRPLEAKLVDDKSRQRATFYVPKEPR